ncbi:hypothetical protein AB833_13570 [Chromatiales bacterium (ex Bugula neritina AB1)]|nr:hypothetical protein AB833_13570 [Chromatiales bacterium (ex Bugula neritina AB1)]
MQQLLYSDASLLRKYARGDAAAFEMLYRRHKDALFHFLHCSLPNAAIVEEIAQDSWVKVIEQAPHYKSTAAFRTWLFTIARNRLIDHQRRKINNTPQTDDSILQQRSSDDLPAEDQALLRELLDALELLPAEQRDSFLLQQQGFSNKEIAEITGVGTETVKSRLRYARSATRERMGATS